MSGREKEILALLAQGKTSQEIDRYLGISRRTLEAHTRSITKKLGASNKTHAVAISFRGGLIC